MPRETIGGRPAGPNPRRSLLDFAEEWKRGELLPSFGTYEQSALKKLLDLPKNPMDATPEQRQLLADTVIGFVAPTKAVGKSLLNVVDDAAKTAARVPTVYRGSHTAPGRVDSSPLHDLSSGAYPDDIYSSEAARYYGHAGGDAMDRETIAILSQYKGKPNAMVRVYRAVPYEESRAEVLENLEEAKRVWLRRNHITKWASDNGYSSYNEMADAAERLKNAPDSERPILAISPGDWVTPSKKYAKQHGEAALSGKYKIISQRVKASDLFTDGNSIYEFGWAPE